MLLKKLINDAEDTKEILRISAALNAIDIIHRQIYRSTLGLKLSNIVRPLGDQHIDRITLLISFFEDIWSYLDVDLQQKFQSYVEFLPEDQLENIGLFLSISDLQKPQKSDYRRLLS